jgi:intracellular sulfur oxidation DsrE/DsrF family protein
MKKDFQSTDRRGFLGKLATGATAMGLATVVSPVQALANAHQSGLTISDADDWMKKNIKGKHRQVFDATNEHEGMPLAWSWVFLTTNNSTGTPDEELSAMVVLRHTAIPIAMEDRLWDKYKLGDVFNIKDKKTDAPATRNPYWKAKEGELIIPGMAVDLLQKRGVLFCVCEMAITVYSGIVAKKMNLNADEVRKDWVSGLLPNVQPVPSGVWAVNRAQEHGCSYVFAG